MIFVFAIRQRCEVTETPFSDARALFPCLADPDCKPTASADSVGHGHASSSQAHVGADVKPLTAENVRIHTLNNPPLKTLQVRDSMQ